MYYLFKPPDIYTFSHAREANLSLIDVDLGLTTPFIDPNAKFEDPDYNHWV